MSRAVSAAREVLAVFLPSYLTGGAVSVGRPLGFQEVEALTELIVRGEVPDAVVEARELHAAAVCPLPDRLALLPREAGAIAVAHNLLALSDPEFGGLFPMLGGLDSAKAWTAKLASTLPRPMGPLAALAAHGLIAPLLSVMREDVLVEFWAGRSTYQGRQVPSRVLKLPWLRRVRVERFDGPALDPCDSPFVAAILGELFLYSPLTNLLSIERELPPFGLGGLACCVADASLCRGLMRAWVFGPHAGLVGGRLALALTAHLRESVDKWEASCWLHAFYHLHVELVRKALLRGEGPAAVGDAACTARTEEERWSLAFFKVLHRGGETFGIPGVAAFGEELAERLSAYDAAAKACDTSEEEREIIEVLTGFFHIVGFPGWPRRYPVVGVDL